MKVLMNTTMSTEDHTSISGRIAIIGLACRVRGVDTPEQLWQAIMEGRETRTHVDDETLRARGVPQRDLDDPDYVRYTRSMVGVENFDAAFFEITPRDARYMDPQQRVFMECCYEAMESAGYAPDGTAMSVGVFAGSATSTYMLSNILPSADADLPLHVLYEHARGNDKDYLTTMVSYKFNLVGPSMSINVACSTGLASVAQACKSLLDHECDMALAGGVRMEFPSGIGYRYYKGNVLSPDGRCSVFDASAKGTVWSDGAGVVLLKRLEDALSDRDFIHATIDGFAVNNDGSNKAGYTSPGSQGQQSVLVEALAFAGIEPWKVGYLEAHGTGTVVGDPIEFDALSRVYAPADDGRPYCALGSLKANFGHMVNAAGMLGLIKAVMVLRHRTLPPQINFQTVNPDIALEGSAFHIPVTPQPWPEREHSRYAAVSAFGIGGTNAHLILREAPERAPAPVADEPHLLLLSSRTADGLNAQASRLREHLLAHPEIALADVACTLRTGRRALPYRAAVVGRDIAAAAAALARATDARQVRDAPPSVVFMLPGQGSQYAAMGRQLYEALPLYRAEVDRCLELLAGSAVEASVRLALFEAGEEAERVLRSTAVTQPAMFVVEYALARVWMSWGLRPDALIGHSLGEYVAACLAEVMSLRDALVLIVARAQAMQASPPGAMLAVALGADALTPYLDADGAQCELAASNSPEHAVLAGPEDAILAVAARLRHDGVSCKQLDVSHAFHSASVDAAIPALRAALSQARLSPPAFAYVSNVTGTWITPEQATSIDYWIAHLRGTVRFSEGLAAIAGRHPDCLLIEVGPGGALGQLARKQPGATMRIVDSLRAAATDEHAHLLASLGACWCGGAMVNWPADMVAGDPHNRSSRRIPLPTYAFQSARHWVDPAPTARNEEASRLAFDQWFQFRAWKSQPAPLAPESPAQRCLLFCDAGSAALADALVARGQEVALVRPGMAYTAHAGCFEIDPDAGEDYRRMAEALRQTQWKPDRVIFAWALAADAEHVLALERVATALRSLMHFVQAFRDDDFVAGAGLRIVTARAFDVLGESAVDPTASAIVAAARTMDSELDAMDCRIVDIDPDEAGCWSALLRELDQPGELRLVALRRGRRWIEQVEPAALPAAALPVIRPGGAYLISGGLGGLGRAVAQWLAGTPDVALTLLGRSSVPDPAAWADMSEAPETPDRLREQLRCLLALQAQGARVRYVAVDMADPFEVDRAVGDALSAFGALDGVFHLAGLPSTSVMRAKTEAEIAAVLGAKVAGAINLERALRPHRPDLVVLFSSIAAALGGIGQFEYAAANAYLDGMAQRLNGTGGTRWLAIGWDSWRDAGMATDAVVPANLLRFKQQELAQAIGNDDGLRALHWVLAQPELVHCLISPRKIASRNTKRLRQVSERNVAELPSSIDTSGWSETERRLLLSWVNLFGYDRIGRNDNFFDLGGDSLLATKAVATINEEWGIDIGVRDFLESRDIEELARLVDALAGGEAAVGEVEEQLW